MKLKRLFFAFFSQKTHSLRCLFCAGCCAWSIKNYLKMPVFVHFHGFFKTLTIWLIGYNLLIMFCLYCFFVTGCYGSVTGLWQVRKPRGSKRVTGVTPKCACVHENNYLFSQKNYSHVCKHFTCHTCHIVDIITFLPVTTPSLTCHTLSQSSLFFSKKIKIKKVKSS